MSRRHNPYNNPKGTWLRGSFHGHCDENSRCASVPLAESVRQYSEVGAGFVALTDHDVVTDLSAMKEAYPHLIFLEGFEYSSRENVLFTGPQVDPLYELSLEEALAKAPHLLTVVCHPRPHADGRDYWTRTMLEDLGVWPDGIEVYNGHYGIEAAKAVGRQPLYSAFWDELLTAGHRLWGYADDDFHDPADFDNAFNMVLVEEKAAEAVVRAAKAGRCYASTGLLLKSVTENNGHIEVELAAPSNGSFIGPEGRVLHKGEGTHFSYRAGDESYVRFEAEGEQGRIFLQPMWIDTTAN
jgi:hypothetical protein